MNKRQKKKRDDMFRDTKMGRRIKKTIHNVIVVRLRIHKQGKKRVKTLNRRNRYDSYRRHNKVIPCETCEHNKYLIPDGTTQYCACDVCINYDMYE